MIVKLVGWTAAFGADFGAGFETGFVGSAGTGALVVAGACATVAGRGALTTACDFAAAIRTPK